MRILTTIVGILLERLGLNHLHLIILELQFHEAVGRNGHLIVVFAFHDGLHRIVGVDLGAYILEVHHSAFIQSVTTLHDGSHVATHTTLFAYGNRQVKMVRTHHHGISARLDKDHVFDIVSIYLDRAAIGLCDLHDILLCAGTKTQQSDCN